MAHSARKLEHTPVFEEEGRVVEAKGQAITVEASSGSYAAKRAVSCLVAPEPSDLVLLAVTSRGAAYVLAVLERPGGAQATVLTAEGDLEVRLPRGRFVVAAQEGLDLVSGKDASLLAGSLKVNAVDAGVVVERLSFIGALVQSEVGRLKVLAESVDSVMTRLYQRVKRSYRVVEEIDQLKAEQIDYEAKKHLALHAKNAVITAEGLVKVDGDQIHVG